MSSSKLKLIYKQEVDSISKKRSIFLLCVFRDEYLLLDYFVRYYQAIGVTHFIMVDNLSVDKGSDYLKSLKNLNIYLYEAGGSYKDADYGTKWLNQLLEQFCIDQYCFVVDVDELFYFNQDKLENLNQLIDKMEESGSNVVPVTLLDMYPKETNNNYKKGMGFLEHSQYFDKYNPVFYKSGSAVYKTFTHKTGGVRQRVFDKMVCIHKFPFFKYNFKPLGVAAGYHFFQFLGEITKNTDKIKLYEKPALLLHFKFIKPDLAGFFKRRVDLNQDWDDSSEYKSYAQKVTDEEAIIFFDKDYSEKLVISSDLNDFF